MARKYVFALVAAGVVVALGLTDWGRMVLFTIAGMVLLPMAAILLASVFLILGIAIGAVALVISRQFVRLDDRYAEAGVDDESADHQEDRAA